MRVASRHLSERADQVLDPERANFRHEGGVPRQHLRSLLVRRAVPARSLLRRLGRFGLWIGWVHRQQRRALRAVGRQRDVILIRQRGEDEVQALLEPERVRHGVPLLSREDVLEAVEERLPDGSVVQLEELTVQVGSTAAKSEEVVALNLAEDLLAQGHVVVALRGAQRVQRAQQLLLPLRRLRHLASHAGQVRELGEEEHRLLSGERTRSVGIGRGGIHRGRRRRLLVSVLGSLLALALRVVRGFFLDLDVVVVVGGVLVRSLLLLLLLAWFELGAHRARLAPLGGGRLLSAVLVFVAALRVVVVTGRLLALRAGLGLGLRQAQARGDGRGGAHGSGGRSRDGVLRPSLERVQRRHENRAVRRLIVDELEEHPEEELLVLAARGDDPGRDESHARRHAVRHGAVVRHGNRGALAG